MNRQASLPGVFVAVAGSGVLLRGSSGIGKSTLALALIERGHQLVADDAAQFSLAADGTVFGCCAAVLQDFIEVRGLGVLNIRRLFGAAAVKCRQRLDLIVCLQATVDRTAPAEHRLQGGRRSTWLLNRPIATLVLLRQQRAQWPLLIECAVANERLRQQGYYAEQELAQRLRHAISCEERSECG